MRSFVFPSWGGKSPKTVPDHARSFAKLYRINLNYHKIAENGKRLIFY